MTVNIYPFKDFQASIDRIQDKYLSFVEGLKSPFREVAVSQFFHRQQKREGLPCISFYMPFWLAEPFGLSGTPYAEIVALVNFYLYHFVTLKDDGLDNRQKLAPLHILLSDIMLGKALELYVDENINAKSFWPYLQKYFAESSEAEQSLWQHKGKVLPYERRDFVMMGRKAALVKLSAAAYANATQQWDTLGPLEEAVDVLCSGIQLIDDLVDWEEDLQERNFTYPLVLAFHSLGNNPRTKLQKDTLESKLLVGRQLFLSGIAERVLKESQGLLQTSKELLAAMKASYLLGFIHSMLGSTSFVQSQVLEKQALEMSLAPSATSASVESYNSRDAYINGLVTRLNILLRSTTASS